MKKISYVKIIVVVCVILQAFTACGQAVKFEETRDIKDFNGISLSINADVYLTQSSNYTVKVMANQDVLEKIKTSVSKGVLTISEERSHSLSNQYKGLEIKIFITLPTIEQLRVTGSGDIKAKKIETKDLVLSVTGSGDISIDNLSAITLSAVVTGSGDIKLASDKELQNCSLSVTGSGDIKAKDLKALSVRASVTGSGDISIHPVKEIEASVSGSGDIRYMGNPNVNVKVAGSGSVRKY